MSKFFPDFFILGAAKAGTTSLYDILNDHEQITMAIVKEPMFFSRDDYYQRGLDWYLKTFFASGKDHRLYGEATPHYLYWAEKVAPRIYEAASQKPIKFVAILRDPVFRAYSWYWNMIKESEEELSFENALAKESERLLTGEELFRKNGSMIYGYKKGSMYATQIKQYLKHFPQDRFYFLLQDDLQSKTKRYLRGLYDFLEVGNRHGDNRDTKRNPSSMPRSRTFQSWLRNRSLIKEFAKQVIPFRTRQALKSYLVGKNTKPFEYPKMSKETEGILRTFFARDVQELQRLVNRDLTHWLPK